MNIKIVIKFSFLSLYIFLFIEYCKFKKVHMQNCGVFCLFFDEKIGNRWVLDHQVTTFSGTPYLGL